MLVRTVHGLAVVVPEDERSEAVARDTEVTEVVTVGETGNHARDDGNPAEVRLGQSANGFFYFQTAHRQGARLYLTGIREAATGKELFYFEIPLDADR